MTATREPAPNTGAEKVAEGTAADRLRDASEAGGARDKVIFLEPASAPLVAGNGAAGTPATKAAIAQAFASDAERAPADDHSSDFGVAQGTASWTPFIWLVAVLIAAAVFVWLLVAG